MGQQKALKLPSKQLHLARDDDKVPLTRLVNVGSGRRDWSKKQLAASAKNEPQI